MKNSISIRKILFLSNKKIALVVFDHVDGQKNILFASQVNLNQGDELKVRINDLLSKANNFLDLSIKEVEVIFDDSCVEQYEYQNEFYDCNDEDEVTKEVYKDAKLKNKYVNEITYNQVIYDDIEKKAICNYSMVAGEYLTFKKFIKAAQECNLKVIDSTNIYSLFNNKKASNQIVICMNDNSTIVSEYALGKLSKVTNFDLQIDSVYVALANRFNLDLNSVKQIISIINNLNADENDETMVSSTFDFAHKRFSGIKANEFIKVYQEEINYLISTKFKLNDYSEVTVVSKDPINKLANAKLQQTEDIIGLDNIDGELLLALANIDSNFKSNTQFKFENSINAKIRTLAA